jgi:hypothetical protein
MVQFYDVSQFPFQEIIDDDWTAVRYESMMLVQYPHQEKIDEDWNAVWYESMMLVQYPHQENIDEDWNAVQYKSMMSVQYPHQEKIDELHKMVCEFFQSVICTCGLTNIIFHHICADTLMISPSLYIKSYSLCIAPPSGINCYTGTDRWRWDRHNGENHPLRMSILI